jgi:hypothetical protein
MSSRWLWHRSRKSSTAASSWLSSRPDVLRRFSSSITTQPRAPWCAAARRQSTWNSARVPPRRFFRIQESLAGDHLNSSLAGKPYSSHICSRAKVSGRIAALGTHIPPTATSGPIPGLATALSGRLESSTTIRSMPLPAQSFPDRRLNNQESLQGDSWPSYQSIHLPHALLRGTVWWGSALVATISPM